MFSVFHVVLVLHEYFPVYTSDEQPPLKGTRLYSVFHFDDPLRVLFCTWCRPPFGSDVSQSATSRYWGSGSLSPLLKRVSLASMPARPLPSAQYSPADRS